MASERTGEIGEARSLGTLAYVEGGEPSSRGRDNGSLARLFLARARRIRLLADAGETVAGGRSLCPEPETAADEPDSEQLQKAFPKIGIAFRHQCDGSPLRMSARKWPDPHPDRSPR